MSAKATTNPSQVGQSSTRLLAVDSCGSRPGAALWDGTGVPDVEHVGEHPPRAEALVDCVRSLLLRGQIEASSLTCLAVLTGPGSFTGLRTGLALARGLALLDDLPVVAVGGLERAAFCAGRPGERVLALRRVGADGLVAAAYRIEGHAVEEVAAATALSVAHLPDVASRLAQEYPGSWVLAVEREDDAFVPAVGDPAGLPRRVVDSQSPATLARIGYTKYRRGVAVRAEQVLPEYFGTSTPRSNRNRVAAPFLVGVTN